jgi:quinol monooxygenase YgiN
MELCVFGRFHAAPGREAELQAALIAVSRQTSHEAGCLSNEVFRSNLDPQTFFIYSRFANEDAFELHIGYPHTLRFVSQLEELVDRPAEVSRAEKISFHTIAVAAA